MHLPPLNALRAFEAAARHESFATAAEELHVSPGAVSRHVKLLEENLGVALFRRRPRGLVLTDAGHKLLPEITASFERIVAATAKLSLQCNTLKIMSPPTLGTRWLIRRLPGFQRRHPELTVNVGVLHEDWDAFYAGNFDAGIVCFETNLTLPPDLISVKVRREALTPVCPPDLFERGSDPRDLEGHVLLHSYPDFQDWKKWLCAAGADGIVDYQSGQTFESMEMGVQAAAAGLGVAIADLYLIRDELESGCLVAPFDLVVSEDTGYFLFCQKGRLDEPAIAAFRDWLIHEAVADEEFRSDKAAGRKIPADVT
ncbi:MAG: LysR substrate-binding domain-containing protein [Pseudomonadota bacterium]